MLVKIAARSVNQPGAEADGIREQKLFLDCGMSDRVRYSHSRTCSLPG
jgi:hypothetical protein